MKGLFNWLSEDVVCIRPRGIAILERVVIMLAIFNAGMKWMGWLFK